MAGLGVSLGIAVAYWALGQFSDQVSNINLLPAALAAWFPDAVLCLGRHLLDGAHADVNRAAGRAPTSLN